MEDVLMEMIKDRVNERVSHAEAAKEQELTVSYIKDIMESFGVTVDRAMDSLKIPSSQRDTYADLVQKRM